MSEKISKNDVFGKIDEIKKVIIQCQDISSLRSNVQRNLNDLKLLVLKCDTSLPLEKGIKK